MTLTLRKLWPTHAAHQHPTCSPSDPAAIAVTAAVVLAFASAALAQSAVLSPQPGLNAAACTTNNPFLVPAHVGNIPLVRADPELAVGPCHVVSITNSGIRTFDKGGLPGALNKPLYTQLQPPPPGPSGFWEPVSTPMFLDTVFDPEVYYDQWTGRFWAVASELDATTFAGFDNWYIALAVTQGSDPNGSWWFYRIKMTGVVPFFSDVDQANLAVDAERVYLSVYATSQSGLRGVVLSKAPLLNGPNAVIVPNASELLAPVVPGEHAQFALKFGPSDGTPQYFIGHDAAADVAAERLFFRAIVTNQTPPTWVEGALGVAPYSRPTSAPQPGTSVRLDTNFDVNFLASAVYRNGHVWAVHGVRIPGSSDPDRSVVRWYTIAPNGWPNSGYAPTIVGTGVLNVPSGVYSYWPSIAVDALGNAAITFNVSGSAQYVSMWRALKCVSESQFRPPVSVIDGQAPVASGNWGDYSGTEPDPSAASLFYSHHHIPDGSGATTTNWKSWVTRWPFDCGLDVDGDGLTTTSDMMSFMTLWQQSAPQADYHGDGAVNVQDLLAFQIDLYGG